MENNVKISYSDMLFSLDCNINKIEEEKGFDEFKYLTLNDVIDIIGDLTEEQQLEINSKLEQLLKVQLKYWNKD